MAHGKVIYRKEREVNASKNIAEAKTVNIPGDLATAKKTFDTIEVHTNIVRDGKVVYSYPVVVNTKDIKKKEVINGKNKGKSFRLKLSNHLSPTVLTKLQKL